MNKVSTLAAKGNGENIPTMIDMDLAKSVLGLHAVSYHGKAVAWPPCSIAHCRLRPMPTSWRQMGGDARLMASLIIRERDGPAPAS